MPTARGVWIDRSIINTVYLFNLQIIQLCCINLKIRVLCPKMFHLQTLYWTKAE